VTVRQFDGMLHGFLGCAGVVDAAWEALDEAGGVVARALRRAAQAAQPPGSAAR
jgi:hypothetical protein